MLHKKYYDVTFTEPIKESSSNGKGAGMKEEIAGLQQLRREIINWSTYQASQKLVRHPKPSCVLLLRGGFAYAIFLLVGTR